MERVMKWAQGNDVWAMAVVETMEETTKSQLLAKFMYIFQASYTLLPQDFMAIAFLYY